MYKQRTAKHSKRRVIIATAVVCVALACAAATVVILRRSESSTQTKPQTATLVVGSGATATSYQLEKVSDPAGLVQGLGGRESLAQNAGMLFSFEDGVLQRCIWMKDMRFNLDVIWLDADYRITSIVPNLKPATYPQSYCANAQYVVELQAGEVAARGLRIGQIVKF